jgi:hypothetical protein
MRDNLTKIKDVAKDVEYGTRDVKTAFVFCIRLLADEVRELKDKVDEK